MGGRQDLRGDELRDLLHRPQLLVQQPVLAPFLEGDLQVLLIQVLLLADLELLPLQVRLNLTNPGKRGFGEKLVQEWAFSGLPVPSAPVSLVNV